MESLPARQSIQRRSSPAPTESASATATAASQPIRSPPVDPQTIFVQKEDVESQQTEEEDFLPTQQQQQQQQQLPPPPPHQEETQDIPKCWICLLDANEDTPDSTPWRSPCPCALVAHEACLLDWIADIESPTKSSTTTSKPKILCPQCKSPIHLARPRDLLVSAFQAAERGIAYTFPKAALLVIGGVVYGACAAGGVHTIYAVFGPEEGRRILEPVVRNMVRPPVDAFVGRPREALQRVWGEVMEHLVHWRLYLGLPLITPTLILSRTSLADGILPILPVLFFVTQKGVEGGELFQWPPSAEFAFAVLPYVRGLYNAWYKRVWAERKKGWLEELQPRVQMENDEMAQAVQPEEIIEEEEDGDNVVEIRVEGGIFDDINDDEEEDDDPIFENGHFMHDGEEPLIEREEARQIARLEEAGIEAEALLQAATARRNAGDRQQQEQQQQANPPAAAGQRPHAHLPANQREVLSFSPTGIAQTVLGALVFPTLAGLAGESLKLLLPSNWFGRGGKAGGPSRTFLQAKWARTLVGGCLLVLGKDALVLYVRWRMARMQRERRVLDFVGKKNLVS